MNPLYDEVKKENQSRFGQIFFVSASTGEGVEQLFQEASQQGYEHVRKEATEITTKVLETKEQNEDKQSGCGC